LIFGAVMILQALYKGMREHRLAQAPTPALALAGAPAAAFTAASASGRPAAGAFASASVSPQLSPLGRFARFLVASDGSEFSASAVREAIAMARTCGAEVHVMSLLATGAEHEALGEAILRQEIEAAQGHLDTIRAEAIAAGVSCETHLIHGQTVDQEIVDLADRVKADIIVMGRRGRRGLARMMLGHATAQVIGHAHCNVLVVPRAAEMEGRHILLATDGSRFAEAAAVTAASLARLCKAGVTVVSVTVQSHAPERRAEAEQAVQRAVGHMRSEGTDAEGAVLDGHPADVIAALAREKHADLIVTGSHGRTGLERVLLGSVSERILNETPCAVLVVKAA
jgi:hypothetical protein